MTNWFYLHWRAFAQACSRLLAQPLSTALSALVVGIALSLPAGGYLVLDNIAWLARGVSGAPEISVFMAPEAAAAQVRAVRQKLDADVRVARHRFVPRDEALAQLERAGLGDVLGGLASNPLPDAFIVVPLGEDPELFDALAGELRALSGVAHVQLDSEWVKRLHALLGLGKTAVLVLAALLGVALVIVTFNTIRLQILTQRAEIEVSRLLGATDLFICRPFYWFGCLQGLLGGLVALGTVWAVVQALRAPVQGLAETYGTVFVLSGPQAPEAAAILGFAALLGWMGSAISVRRHLAGDRPG